MTRRTGYRIDLGINAEKKAACRCGGGSLSAGREDDAASSICEAVSLVDVPLGVLNGPWPCQELNVSQ